MARTRVKICGITRSEDAQAAIAAGADALGFVFYEPSPRAVSIEQAAQVAKDVPAFVTNVALFVNPTEAQVRTVLEQVRIDLIQFHGDEDNDFCRQFNRPFIKAQRVRQTSDVVASCLRFPDALAILLDSYKPGVPGGTGESFNWDLIPETAEKPIILAGGLTSENVAQAIEQVAPFAVDVSGGVEMEKGIKDAQKIQAFLREVYRVNRL
ncbi:phosphoribosylanthranilate isomerase [Bermanella sp. R86510]|uniref:phosphoribosylanthranilate isomerase n=1 Tax=unclassified Bermanella TaxID=2627862 RepID=UPI0037CC83D8